jgi:hypothetical protein
VEDGKVYKHCIYDVHIKLSSATSTAGGLTKEICQTAEQAISHHFAAKSQASYLKMLHEVVQPDTKTAILPSISYNYSFFTTQEAIQGLH